MRRAAVLVLVCIALAAVASAQNATVVRNVNIRPEPSSYEDPIGKLKPGDTVTLMSPEGEDNYYRIRTQAGLRSASGCGRGAPAVSATPSPAG